MHYWSEGLGRRQLIINLAKSKLTRKADFLELSGVVDAPAPWEYEIEVEFADWQAILTTATRPETGAFLVQRSSMRELIAIATGLGQFLAVLAWYRMRHLLGFDRDATAADNAARELIADPANEKAG